MFLALSLPYPSGRFGVHTKQEKLHWIVEGEFEQFLVQINELLCS